MQYTVVAVPVGGKPFRTKMSFKDIQEYVGGDVQMFNLFDDIYILVNEDGNLINLPFNRAVVIQNKSFIPIPIKGNFVLVHNGKDDYENMSESEIKECLYIFRVVSEDATVFI